MEIKSFINSLKKSFGTEGQKSLVSRMLYKEDKKILALLRAHSPVDTGTFRDNWAVARPRFGSTKTLAGIRIINNTPFYGQFVAGGALPGQAPWYYPHRNKATGRFKKGTGKLKLSDGRVWAGGLKPGHSKTVGGPIVQVLSKYTDKFIQEFSDEFAKGSI